MRGTLEVGEHGRGKDARLDVAPDRDHRGPEVAGAELAHRVDARRVGLGHVCDHVPVLLDVLRVDVDPEDLVAQLDQRLREVPAEASEPDDEELLPVSQ